MNEIRHREFVQTPKVIRIDISVDLAYKFQRLLDDHVKQNPLAKLAAFISHKFEVLFFKQRFHEPYALLADKWRDFCVWFIQQKLKGHPMNKDLQRLFVCFSSGREVPSA